MEIQEWHDRVDKSAWGPGPWNMEPDKAQWPDEATGLPCLLKRHGRWGNLCGYVGVPEGHPWWGLDYTEIPVDVGVHGGLTYASHCEEGGDKSATICHVPAPGEPDNVWWLGFDCGHFMDYQPGIASALDNVPSAYAGVYRSADFVIAECANLAAEIKAAGR
jgi:hypothetical protein